MYSNVDSTDIQLITLTHVSNEGIINSEAKRSKEFKATLLPIEPTFILELEFFR